MNLDELKDQLNGESIVNQLWKLADLFPGKIIFTTSFGIEDQVISHFIFENNIPVEVATLDTGRLFKETYSVFNATVEKYQKKIKVYFPDYEAVERMMTEKGPLSFYYSKENRLECCSVRKVAQLDRMMDGMVCWISGIRAAQSENRGQMQWLEFDEGRKLFKFYPLFEWSFDEVKNFIKVNNVPYNVLHDRGFVSIGCEPCTRAVVKGEDFRSGRWWWETDGKKECGFHIR